MAAAGIAGSAGYGDGSGWDTGMDRWIGLGHAGWLQLRQEIGQIFPKTLCGWTRNSWTSLDTKRRPMEGGSRSWQEYREVVRAARDQVKSSERIKHQGQAEKLLQDVLQPHCPSCRRERHGLGDRRITCWRRWGSRPSKAPESAQVHAT
uniref:uncharacterized protein n=1 Tax=Lonchura striata TaxID=40157 RepID=UPI000B4D67B1|nr:uncharacterized protein LOC110474837 [Lonchura striata domestica]